MASTDRDHSCASLGSSSCLRELGFASPIRFQVTLRHSLNAGVGMRGRETALEVVGKPSVRRWPMPFLTHVRDHHASGAFLGHHEADGVPAALLRQSWARAGIAQIATFLQLFWIWNTSLMAWRGTAAVPARSQRKPGGMLPARIFGFPRRHEVGARQSRTLRDATLYSSAWPLARGIFRHARPHLVRAIARL